MTSTIPSDIEDPINLKILAVSEDRVKGFCPQPFAEIARLSGVDEPTVLDRLSAMLRAGTIRRIRQTLMATNLAHGALVAWRVPEEKLQESFDWMFANDPFSGHVVIRSTDPGTAGSAYRLWTTLKVPQGYSLQKHGEYLRQQVGAEEFLLMPAKRVFALGVGHVRRRGMEPGSKADVAAEPAETQLVRLTEEEWRVLIELKRELAPEEIGDALWQGRCQAAGVPLDRFCEIATSLNQRGVIGRFSTFLEHVKPLSTGQRVTRFNALFHWAAPKGMELKTGMEVGRFHIMTHAYWREGGPAFNNVNIMGVVHGTDRQVVLTHKKAIDDHLASQGIPIQYTNVFWGGRSEIKPSEISPFAYRDWCIARGIDPETMRAAETDDSSAA